MSTRTQTAPTPSAGLAAAMTVLGLLLAALAVALIGMSHPARISPENGGTP
jgi:hypothetical protein